MHPIPRLVLAAMLCTSVVACSKKVKETPPPPTTGDATAPADTAPAPYTPAPGAYTAADLDRDACLRQRSLYFDLDRDGVKPEFQNLILCHAKYLRDRPMARLTLEGNTDERGSQEYNLGLGERRANAVMQALQAQGASNGQVTVVSFGEERPECRESNEGCWSKNRRADLNYTVP
ncbi:peptidoglycan-associated lipoprotein Pal [Lysobacter pythonis]|uniref:Peptidoglycan-associated lipoprotein n=1 Tax=Solilutibacter pythonis TaxID=2483112 RepID=A0A3M2HWM0_9GAMM|nr:peptidoglycan-associated lipoprotein Pal [Lysobacter pythonis]RMH94131.1 peptidoglycan-associated lipoprotein Pal [Lysobacter pythonis]